MLVARADSFRIRSWWNFVVKLACRPDNCMETGGTE